MKKRLYPDWYKFEEDRIRKLQEIDCAFGNTSRIVYSLPKCLECGAVVEDDDKEKHCNWHRSK